MHFQERGNRPLPTDLVKVLKSQDEGYIRATKVANLKRIDRLKDELSSLLRRDLINEDADSDGVDKDGWEDDELEALRSLGLVSQKRRRHTVFVDDAASGVYRAIPCTKLFSDYFSENILYTSTCLAFNRDHDRRCRPRVALLAVFYRFQIEINTIQI